MVNFPGRNGRRRRVLNDEVLSTSGAHARQAKAADDLAQAPRYSDAAGVENHPQITDFVPRRYRTIGMLAVTAVGTSAALGALHYFAPTAAAFLGLPSQRPFDMSAPGSIASWVAAVVLLLASATCLLIYSIRRHRIDDFRGRYRVWLGAGVACLVVSANSVAGLHQTVAHTLAHLVGWTALRDNAVWWIAVAGLPIAWIGIRALLDVRECRLAATFLVAAVISSFASAASYFSIVPVTEQQNAALVTGTTLLTGCWFVLAAVVTYARYVVLDAQGLITTHRTVVRKQTRKQEAAKPVAESPAAEAKPSVLSVVNYARAKAAKSSDDEESDRWIDGSRPERKSYKSYDADDEEDADDSSSSKVSKADRKRLRKLKTQNRAA